MTQTSSKPVIRLLNSTLINQIAAGEVIERPAAAVKELAENAIDAGATYIEILLREGGRTLIQVTDNGCGMTSEDLNLAVERHATSKLPDEDLFNIRSFGFRGEALPSIAAVSRLTLTSRTSDQETAWELQIEGGNKKSLVPASHPVGTRVSVRDLFYATPARLKFLKTVSTELSHCVDYLNRLAMAHPHVGFVLKDNDRMVLNYRAHRSLQERLQDILKEDFIKGACPVHATREELNILGWISLPTYHRSQSSEQFLFVNNRPVRDKLFHAAVKIAYQDLLASHRYPVVVLFLTLNPDEVDVNVHPAKTEVRFRDPQIVRGLIINALKQTLATYSQSTSPHLGSQALAVFRHTPLPARSSASNPFEKPVQEGRPLNLSFSTSRNIYSQAATALREASALESASFQSDRMDYKEHPLGRAVAQIHTTFILAETAEGFLIVDQHAAHERLVYEKLKQHFKGHTIASQSVLLPEVVQLSSQNFEILSSHLSLLEKVGFGIDVYGTDTVVVRAVPALLGESRMTDMIHDLIADLKELGQESSLTEKFCDILSGVACRTSIRAGKKMSLSEMDALLRQMEQTLYSGQCNHGRPTYIELKKEDIEKLFGRR